MSRGSKIAVNVVVTVLSLAYIVFSLVELKDNNDGRKVARIEVFIADSDSIQFISEQEVVMLIEDSVMNCGELFDSVKLFEVEALLGRVPCIKRAEVSSDMDGVVHVEVQQRKADFRLMCESGEDYYVADTFFFIAPVDGYRPKVAVVSGKIDLDITSNRLNTQSVKKSAEQVEFTKKIHTFVEIIEGDEFLQDFIEQIYVARHSQSGKVEIELIPSVGSGYIRFGELQNIEDKLLKIKDFYSSAYNYANLKDASEVDVRFDHQIIVR